MKKDVTELKKMFVEILQNPTIASQNPSFINELKDFKNAPEMYQTTVMQPATSASQSVVIPHTHDDIHHHEEVEESLNIMDVEKELIIKALKKHKGKRKDAAADLGISERTLYRKLKEYDIKE
jgi:DNA-binding NtrC family response regulator